MKTEDKQVIKGLFNHIDLELDGQTIFEWHREISRGNDVAEPDWAFVRQCYQAVIHRDPNNIKALTGIADLLNDIDHDCAEALSYYQKVVKLKPNDFQHQYNLAIAYHNNDKDQQMIKQHLLRAIEARPNWFCNEDLEIETDLIYTYTTVGERQAIYKRAVLTSGTKAVPWFLLAAAAGAGISQSLALTTQQSNERQHETRNNQ